eukprot:2241791-Alexandrium_andersonii.AAC.1
MAWWGLHWAASSGRRCTGHSCRPPAADCVARQALHLATHVVRQLDVARRLPCAGAVGHIKAHRIR